MSLNNTVHFHSFPHFMFSLIIIGKVTTSLDKLYSRPFQEWIVVNNTMRSGG